MIKDLLIATVAGIAGGVAITAGVILWIHETGYTVISSI